jgi:hypothetical protein
MHGYILTGKSLVCMQIPEEHVHEKMFQGGWSGKDSVVETYVDARKKRVAAHGKLAESEKGKARRTARLSKADNARKERLSKKGIKYNYSGYQARNGDE